MVARYTSSGFIVLILVAMMDEDFHGDWQIGSYGC